MKTVKFPAQGSVFEYCLDPLTRRFLPWGDRVPLFEMQADTSLQVNPRKRSEEQGQGITPFNAAAGEKIPPSCKEAHILLRSFTSKHTYSNALLNIKRGYIWNVKDFNYYVKDAFHPIVGSHNVLQ